VAVPKKPVRLGRPPSSSSADTRERIVEIAVQAFAELGYETTTNKFIAGEAGITTGALYHYFDSKILMYQAAYEHVQRAIYERLASALDGIDGFVARLEAVLEAAHDLNGDEPSLARFIGAARVDMARNDELRAVLGRPVGPGYSFFDVLVDDGIASGEITRSNRKLVMAFIRIIVVGLTDGASEDNDRHRVAVDAVRAAIEGRLFAPVAPTLSAAKVRTQRAG
jgi:AcrR family transcriptional regulator